MNLSRLIPIFDNSVSSWALEARLLRWLTLIWLFVGLIMLFSASYTVAAARQDDGLYYFKRQLLWVLVSLILFNIIVHLPLKKILGVQYYCAPPFKENFGGSTLVFNIFSILNFSHPCTRNGKKGI